MLPRRCPSPPHHLRRGRLAPGRGPRARRRVGGRRRRARGRIEHPTPWPTLDVASLDGADGIRRLYVVPIDSSALWLFDRDTDCHRSEPGRPVDQGMSFTRACSASRRSSGYTAARVHGRQVRVAGRSVAVVLANNRVVFAHEETGCLVQDNLGPRTETTPRARSLGSETTIRATSPRSRAPRRSRPRHLPGRHVLVNTCSGTAPPRSGR